MPVRPYVCCLALLAAFAACAAEESDLPLPVPVQVDAPAPLRELLEQHLVVYRAGNGADDAGDRVAVARAARAQAASLLATEGYFSPVIDVDVADDRGEPIQVRIGPGPRARIGGVEIEFAGDVAGEGPQRAARREAIRREWSLVAGQPFRQAAWDGAKQAALRSLAGERYALATIADSAARVDPDEASVALRVLLDSGPAFVFGELQVSGLEDYDAALVARYNTIVPGEPYSQARLLDLQGALQNTPYFAAVTVEVDAEGSRDARLPLLVNVREARPKRIGFGAGYSSNTGARGEVSFRHANLFDRGWNFASGLRLEQKTQFAYADVYLPPSEKDYRDSFGALAELSDIQGLKLDRRAAAAVRTRSRGRIETRIALNLENETRRPDDAARERRQALALTWGWTYRDVDDPIDPRRGYVLGLEAGGGSRLALSDADFLRTYVRGQGFLPLGARSVAILRLEAGSVNALDRKAVPEQFLFRAGGVQSVRGYAYRSLGVREGTATVGGRRLLVGSVELAHWFGDEWGGAVFYDAGNAWDSREGFGLVSGVGAGVRWRSPAGPLAFDLAYGREERKLRPHFSVQIAF